MTSKFQRILPIILACASFCLANLEVVHEWKYIDYVWESDVQRAAAIEDETYNHTKIVTYDMQPLPDGRMLVITPKFYDNPASLSTVSNQTGDGGPLLAPYPDWSWHNREDCSGIISVSRVFLDDCNRLWLVDSGIIGYPQVCPAKILAFDVATDELIQEFVIPMNLSHSPNDPSKGRLQIYAVETTEDSCENFLVYVFDLEGHGLVMWDGSDIWRLDESIFIPASENNTFNVGAEEMTMPNGPVVLLVLPPGYFEPNVLLFRNLLGPNTYVATLDDIRNSKSGTRVKWWKSNYAMNVAEPARVIAKFGGVLFSGFPATTQYACWNVANPLADDTWAVLETNNETLQYASNVKTTVNSNGKSETVWVMTNRLQKFILRNTDVTEINFRIMAADIDSYIAGTVCAPGKVPTPTSIEAHNFSPVD